MDDELAAGRVDAADVKVVDAVDLMAIGAAREQVRR